ncbi:MAG: hypothetical protein KDA24_29100 [Deltaproteobacteria bacterium]|nr:hypothetical protein [Deltaproteobacteria bacterium]
MSLSDATAEVDSGAELKLANRSFSIVLWAEVAPKAGFYGANILRHGSTAARDQMLHVGIRSTGKAFFAFYSNDLDTQAAYSDGQLHHYAFTFDHQTRTRIIYVDGEEVARDVSPSDYVGSGKLILAGMDNPPFDGTVGGVQVVGGTMTAAHVRKAMSRSMPSR